MLEADSLIAAGAVLVSVQPAALLAVGASSECPAVNFPIHSAFASSSRPWFGPAFAVAREEAMKRVRRDQGTGVAVAGPAAVEPTVSSVVTLARAASVAEPGSTG